MVHGGRALDNDIVINDVFVSSYHLEVRPWGGGMLVRDLGSRSGTFVNGQRITEQVVPLTAMLQLGPNVTLPVARLMQQLTAAPQPSLFMRRPTELASLIAGVGLGRVVGKERTVILQDVDVCVRRGRFIAIVGGSGAGKSTLMQVLNGYTPPEMGVLYRARTAQGGEEEIGYVPQEDIIHRALSLREAIVLSALLRYPPGTPRELVERRAEEVLAQLGLAEHQHTLVSRLSGDQRKRASVALELMRNPPLLILDEPTTGLDPASGRRLVKLLRSLANSGEGTLLVMFFILWRVPGGEGAFTGILVAGFLAAFCGMAVGLAISASAPTPDRAMTLVPVAMIPQIMFGGAVIPLRDGGQGKHISVIVAARWAFEALGRLTERAQYLDPARSLHYAQMSGSWLEPVAMLAGLGVAFAGLAVWLVARQAPSARTTPAFVGVPGYVYTPGPVSTSGQGMIEGRGEGPQGRG